MNQRIAIFVTAILAAAPGTLFAAGTPAQGALPTFTAQAPATGVTAVDLTVGVGDVSVSAGKADTVKVTVAAEPGGGGHFIFNWTTGTSSGGIPADLHLVVKRRGTDLVVRLAGAGGNDSGPVVVNPMGTIGGGASWKGHWTLVLPARLAMTLKGGVGKFSVSGLAGGLTAKIGVGDLDAALVNGPVDASIGVGKISADVANPDYGDITLTAGVGDVTFTVKGKKVDTGYQHHFTSATQHAQGAGTTSYRLEAGTGHVELNLGVKGALQTNDNAPDGSSDGGQ